MELLLSIETINNEAVKMISSCGNFKITKEESTKTCSGFIFLINAIYGNGDLLPFHESGALKFSLYAASHSGIKF